MTKPQPLHVKNAHVYNGNVENSYDERNLYTTDVVVAERPEDAITVDLSGYTIFPGLINAHDHLEMNHYPRTKYRERYDNAHQWGEDVNAHLNESPFRELRAYPLEDRCFIGGLKNLLCGATTVVHHNPPHKCLFKRNFPVRILKEYTWAHSLYLNSAEEIQAASRRNRSLERFFIHLAEGTDESAAQEYQQLKKIGGIVASCTVLIHCVGMTRQDVVDAEAEFVSGVIWCPSTNLYLLGKTLDFETFWHPPDFNINAIGLGSDSRLTADGDFLDEIRVARRIISANDLLDMVFWGNAFLIGIEELYGQLKFGAPADWIALPQDKDILDIRRADLALVVRGGVPQIGDPEVMAKFTHIETVAVRLDDKEKRMNVQLARQVARCSPKEPGLELLEDPLKSTRTRLWRR